MVFNLEKVLLRDGIIKFQCTMLAYLANAACKRIRCWS